MLNPDLEVLAQTKPDKLRKSASEEGCAKLVSVYEKNDSHPSDIGGFPFVMCSHFLSNGKTFFGEPFRNLGPQETLAWWQRVGVHWNGEVFARHREGLFDQTWRAGEITLAKEANRL